MVGKIQKPFASKIHSASSAPAARPQDATAPAPAKGWVPKTFTRAAAPQSKHPFLEHLGKAVGLGLGVAVTEGLRLVPGWDKPVLDGRGKEVDTVKGAKRDGDYAIRKRHEEVIGPQVAAKAEKLKPGALHDLVAGLGEGASEAPGASYRLDAKLDHTLHPKRK